MRIPGRHPNPKEIQIGLVTLLLLLFPAIPCVFFLPRLDRLFFGQASRDRETQLDWRGSATTRGRKREDEDPREKQRERKREGERERDCNALCGRRGQGSERRKRSPSTYLSRTLPVSLWLSVNLPVSLCLLIRFVSFSWCSPVTRCSLRKEKTSRGASGLDERVGIDHAQSVFSRRQTCKRVFFFFLR